MTPALDAVLSFATAAHLGQKDKGGESYILHPIRMMLRARTHDERVVSLLHDVIEDTAATTLDARRLGCTETQVVALMMLTKNRGQTPAQYLNSVLLNPLARAVKILDLEDNMDVKRLPMPLTDKDLERLNKYRTMHAVLVNVK